MIRIIAHFIMYPTANLIISSSNYGVSIYLQYGLYNMILISIVSWSYIATADDHLLKTLKCLINNAKYLPGVELIVTQINAIRVKQKITFMMIYLLLSSPVLSKYRKLFSTFILFLRLMNFAIRWSVKIWLVKLFYMCQWITVS